jgi:hypothetical protein
MPNWAMRTGSGGIDERAEMLMPDKGPKKRRRRSKKPGEKAAAEPTSA